MDMRELAKKKKAIAMIHKTDNELMDMAENYAENVGFAGGTIAKISGPGAAEIGNVARQIENSKLREIIKQYGPKVEKAVNDVLQNNMHASPEVRDSFIKKLIDQLTK